MGDFHPNLMVISDICDYMSPEISGQPTYLATLNESLDSRITASIIKDTENKQKYQPDGSTVP
jgi:hypothetical protein